MTTNFNYAEDRTRSTIWMAHSVLTVLAQSFTGSTRGQLLFDEATYNVDHAPVAATIRLDDNGGGPGWFFDETPSDDVEFASVGHSFRPRETTHQFISGLDAISRAA